MWVVGILAFYKPPFCKPASFPSCSLSRGLKPSMATEQSNSHCSLCWSPYPCEGVQLFIDTQLFSRILLPKSIIKILLSNRKTAMLQIPCLQNQVTDVDMIRQVPCLGWQLKEDRPFRKQTLAGDTLQAERNRNPNTNP